MLWYIGGMKLAPWQNRWIQDYEAARVAGGLYNNADSLYVPFEEIELPEWYQELLSSTAAEKEEVQEEVDEPIQQEEVKQAVSFSDVSNAARELGRKGGLKTKERGVEYYRAIGRLGGRGHKKIS